ncbi:conserved Plasmodium protein, unknown function [Plasmodium berghei]|uniref:RNA-editing substrate-binding complex 6 protein domain-containing protein n=2 Tax=Plasmodium berghei TaxID=5821 RepID=A0A509AK56_PLABA|nr:conserved protein, unknown function [Plasmodium berghei ANKA]CXI59348.1 conserved Plasmodium protein, unknown function [Plasmodium berghei]SCM23447.1 conserved Plasmodium protein, unknown function [Plasmodium berghei]SCN26597.1 conserved Plasmodium protein, unknown function [Plasmodium berghei]SCO60860.1 conserved Plasmodium protein, unknown function [Plasmodium berghei]SCO62854.1 conserved Plasmodium protein, unknown function [Plasmodium berghei]|eukprot:XP_034422233.1 conserved protein, unknown function [Plasmodium berghei ANKA]
MLSLNLKKLGGGVGRRLCMPIYSGTSDCIYKDKHFVLRKINQKYENVLLFGDVNKLRNTAIELIQNISEQSENNCNNDSYINDKLKKYENSYKFLSEKLEEGNETDSDDNKTIDLKQKLNKEKKITKKLSFWQIYSIRVKKSLHLLNSHDFSLILQSFHLYNKDTGIYVMSIKYVEDQIPNMNGTSFVILLNIFSKRLKKHSYDEFFRKMIIYIPNIMYDLNLKDINNILNIFYNIELNNPKICEMFYKKILSNINKEGAFIISSLCYIFYKYNFEYLHFFERLKKRGLSVLNDFDAIEFYKFIFSLYKKNICLKEIINHKKNDVIALLPNYNEEQKIFICDIFGIK